MAISVESRDRAKADFYPLAPMQEGMLFHTLCSPHEGTEIEQLICDLQETLDPALLKRAWESTLARHAILRTSFHWEGHPSPVQQVHERVALPWAEQDWTDLKRAQQEEAFAQFLQADRVRGFKPSEAPLLRVTFFRLGNSTGRMVWTFHHALLDGRSFPMVLRDVFAFHEALLSGDTLSLPHPREYREHIQWLGKQSFGTAESFWRKQLQGFSAPTPLMVDRRDLEPGPIRNGSLEETLSSAATAALETLARDHGLTLNTLVQAAWALLLSRYSGEKDVVFGVTRACRRSGVEGAESIVGLFINTLPLRVRIEPGTALLPWLKKLREDWRALRDYEHTPLVQVQAWSEVPHATPLFESLVVYEHRPLNETLQAGGGKWANRTFRLCEQPDFPLTLAAYGGEQLCLKILFHRTRFDEATIERMLGHLVTLLSGMAAHPDLVPDALPLLTRKERQELLFGWNQPQLAPSPDRCLHQLFEVQAGKTPEATALVWEQNRWTYRELNDRAERIAHALRASGVKPETIVALCLDRTPELVAALLGILKAGGAYLPIESTCPPERIAFMLSDSQSTVVVTQKDHADQFDATQASILCIDALPTLAENLPSATVEVHPGNAAYVIYTSGSTGQPKGVIVTHANVVRLFSSTQPWFQFSHLDVWTLFHSAAFDFSVWEIWGALLYGGSLVIVPHLVARSPETFHELLARERVTVLNQTPSAFRQLIQAGQNHSGALALRWIVFGGEALDLQILKPWFDRHGDQQPQLVNMYGITETTVHVTYRPLQKQDLHLGSVIGVPIPDLQLYILDEHLEPVPIGVAGEIYVGGAGLARGYLNRPELTAERFIASPFSDAPGARLYKTGDRARFLAGREIEYLGRSDDQIKIRGFRIEPGEIAAVLMEHPTVREAVVLAREDQPSDRRLIAYFVTNGPAPDLEALRSLLKTRLPDYMIPSTFVSLDRLPLTSNGKLDRRALPAPSLEREAGNKSFAAPRTGLERTIAEIWQNLLGVSQVGLDDNFFEIGGHSLLLVQLHYRLQAALSRSVPITVLFQHPTVGTLARHFSASPESGPKKASDRARRIRDLQETLV